MQHYTEAPIFYARPNIDYFQEIGGERGGGSGGAGGGGSAPRAIAKELQKWFVFCGIGNPAAAFLADVRADRHPVVGHKFFRDLIIATHRPTRRVSKRRLAHWGPTASSAPKRIDTIFPGAAGAGDGDIYFCGISMRIDREQGFWAAIDAAAARNARRETNLPACGGGCICRFFEVL